MRASERLINASLCEAVSRGTARLPLNASEHLLDASLKEVVSRGTAMFPCAWYDADLEQYLNREVPWHWHEELEVGVVTRGTATLECGQNVFTVNAGQGLFINSNVLHTEQICGDRGCCIKVLVFDRSLITGTPESVYEQKYMRPILAARSLESLLLSPDVAWQAEAIHRLLRAYELYTEAAFGYELQVREHLSHFWYLLALHTKPIIEASTAVANADAERVRRMLSFIYDHYSEPITVSDIAAAASVGESECFRSFKRLTAYSPVAFLLNYRICAAANMLTFTDKSIAEICRACGFNSPSYFTKVFREQLHRTPRDYRTSTVPPPSLQV